MGSPTLAGQDGVTKSNADGEHFAEQGLLFGAYFFGGRYFFSTDATTT
jgi:hypothetical protein